MNTSKPFLWSYVVRGLAASVWLMLTACAVYPLAPESDSIQAVTSGQSGYPGLLPSDETPRPLPTMVDGSPNIILSYFATPAPNEKVAVVGVASMASPQIPQPYTIEGETIDPTTGRTTLYVVKNPSGDRIRLGDETGSAILAATSDNYVAWFFACDSCTSIANGLHVYSVGNDKNTLVAGKFYSVIGTVKITGLWMTYLYPNPDGQTSQLYAYHIPSGEAVLVADDAYYSRNDAASYVALNEEMVAWVNRQPAGGLVLNVYDLANETKQQLKVQLSSLKNLDVSRDVVVWWDIFWKGYDLVSDEVFTVPIVPPGWDASMIKSVGPVKAKGRQLSWTLERDGGTYYFIASVAEKESQPPQPTPEPPIPTAPVSQTSYP